MTWVATAIIGSAIIGGVVSNNASHTAAKAATTAAANNNDLQRQIYDQNNTNLQPWMQRGNTAGAAQAALLGLGGDTAGAQGAFNNWRGSTDYTFQQDEARRATDAAFAARGGFRSGAAYKALQDRSQNIAGSYFQRYIDNLGSVDQRGFAGASAVAGVGQNYAGAVGANNDSAASAVGNAALSSAANTNSVIGQAGSTLGYLYGQGRFGSSAAAPSSATAYNPAWQGG